MADRKFLFLDPAGTWLLLVALCLFLTGCNSDSFIGRRVDNFTAYYNTFYNAKKEYKDGVENLERSEQQINRNFFVPVFTNPGRSVNAQAFDEAIRKSADVLRENPDSKWVDDALLLIGKSYFYMQNYVGAEEKFNEVIGLGGALSDEARFWLARTLTISGAFERSANHLKESLSIEDLSPRWEGMLRLALGELYVRQEAWNEAAEELALGLDLVKDRNAGARARFLLGQVQEKRQEYMLAIEAYQRVSRYKPEYDLLYAAQVGVVRLEGEQGDQERALRLVRSMERDDKHYENRGELAYLKGRVYQAMELPDEAFFVYDELLFNDDRTLNINNVKGRVHYALGELYRDAYVDFTYAAAHFDTARRDLQSQLRQAGQGANEEVNYSAEAITDSEDLAETFGTFAEVYERIATMDSLLYLGSMDDSTFAAFIMDLRVQKAEELAEEQRSMERRQAEQQFGQIDTMERGQLQGTSSTQVNPDAGFLFHKDQIQLQEGRLTFIDRWGDRPRVPDWRRLDAILSAATAENSSEGEVVKGQGIATRLTPTDEAPLPEVDYSDVPRDPESRGTMIQDLTYVRYELGNVLFLSMARPDSAAAWYRLVIEEGDTLEVAQRAYYALAEVQRALGDEQSANQLYQDVLSRFPDSDFSDHVREQLGLPVEAQPVILDSLELAERAYEEAYMQWQEEAYSGAIREMLLLASNYRSHDIAPRALLATGQMYLEWANLDTMDVRELPLPVIPDSLLISFGLVDEPSLDSLLAIPPRLPDTMLSMPVTSPDSTLLQETDPVGDVQVEEEAEPEKVKEVDTPEAPNPALEDSVQANLSERTKQLSITGGEPDRETPADSVQTDLTLPEVSVADSSAEQVPSDSLAAVLQQVGDSSLVVEEASVVKDSLNLKIEQARMLHELITATHAALSDTLLADSIRSQMHLESIVLDSLNLVLVSDSLVRDTTTGAGYYVVATPLPNEFQLERLYNHILEAYPGTPHAEKANLMIQAFAEVLVDTTSMVVQTDTMLVEEAPALSAEEEWLLGPEPLVAEEGGWTLVASSFSEQQDALESMQKYADEGFRVTIVKAPTRFRVCIGSFPTLEDAQETLGRFAEQLPPNTWFMDFAKPR